MKIQYVSDLHLEFQANSHHLRQHPLLVAGDVLVMAGDIHVLGTSEATRHDFFSWCADHYEQTLIVPGNHEFYGGLPIDECIDDWELPLRSNVRYLNNRSVRTGDVELFFSTLWSRINPVDEALAESHMADFRRSVFEGRQLHAGDYALLHEHCMTWLIAALQSSDAPHRVVVTHHCPVQAEDPRYQSNGLTGAFIVPLERFIASQHIDAWIFGHTHYNGARGMLVGDTCMCVNQLGYVEQGIENGYRPDAMIEIL